MVALPIRKPKEMYWMPLYAGGWQHLAERKAAEAWIDEEKSCHMPYFKDERVCQIFFGISLESS